MLKTIPTLTLNFVLENSSYMTTLLLIPILGLLTILNLPRTSGDLLHGFALFFSGATLL